MHAASIHNSDRLKRVLFVLRMGPMTTRQIIKEADVCAVNSIVAELRANGYEIKCDPVPGKKGHFLYALKREPVQADAFAVMA